MRDRPIPLLVILGPTAVGKSRLALALARRLGGEIVSADSAQVYRFMDIGTDKPSPADRAAVPHHLVDVRDPDEPFSVAEYQAMARAAIDAVAARGRLPVLAGGTGLYIRAVVSGAYAFPAAAPDPALRAALTARAEAGGIDPLYRQLQAVDPVAAARIDPRNARRVIRALEVYLQTGVPFSRRGGGAGAAAAPGGTAGAAYDALLVGLTREREDLYARIDARVEDQLRRGLVDEVRGILARGYDPSLPALQALGYKEVIAHLRGEVPFEEMVRVLKRNTRRYAKRQWTWFRREEGVRWFNLTQEDPAAVEEEVVRLVRARGWA